MQILLLGSGGREHALAWKITQSPLVSKLYILPALPLNFKKCEPLQLELSDHFAIGAFCLKHKIDLVMVGPEAPLVAGIVDYLESLNILVFGPSRAAAQLEGSKGFTRDLCHEFNIPGPHYKRFTCLPTAKKYLAAHPLPVVIKQDGLAAGKGVVVTDSREEAVASLERFFTDTSAPEVIIEECLVGEEASFFCICDGDRAIPFGTAQDHKRLKDGDLGPNTGGMGAYSPAQILTPALEQQVMDTIIAPTLKGMQLRGAPFKGILYAGLMLTAEGPKLIEYNVRFGDPECQSLMRRLDEDLVPWLMAAARGQLPDKQVRWSPEFAISIVMAAKNYPESPQLGDQIYGLDHAMSSPGIEVFLAGVKQDADGAFYTNGGRVLAVTSRDNSLAEAQRAAYEAVQTISWQGAQWRSDIAYRALRRDIKV